MHFFNKLDYLRAIPILAKIPSNFNTDYEVCQPKKINVFANLFGFGQNQETKDIKISAAWTCLAKRNLPCKVKKEMQHSYF